MKIERNSKVCVLFKDVKKGDVFIDDDGDVCMKIDYLCIDSNDIDVNAVTLGSGDPFFVENGNFVWIPQSAKLVVEE